MIVLPRPDWTPTQALSVAALVIDPACNGGTVSDLTPEMVVITMPDAPAWAVFDDAQCVFVVGLNPFQWNHQLTRLRGALHFARRPTFSVRNGYRMVASFLDALPGVEIVTITDNPALARLAMRAGLLLLDKQGVYYRLGR